MLFENLGKGTTFSANVAGPALLFKEVLHLEYVWALQLGAYI